MTTADVNAVFSWVAARDPELVAAAADVDQSLLDWCLSLSPGERLTAAARATAALARFERVTPQAR